MIEHRPSPHLLSLQPRQVNPHPTTHMVRPTRKSRVFQPFRKRPSASSRSRNRQMISHLVCLLVLRIVYIRPRARILHRRQRPVQMFHRHCLRDQARLALPSRLGLGQPLPSTSPSCLFPLRMPLVHPRHPQLQQWLKYRKRTTEHPCPRTTFRFRNPHHHLQFGHQNLLGYPSPYRLCLLLSPLNQHTRLEAVQALRRRLSLAVFRPSHPSLHCMITVLYFFFVRTAYSIYVMCLCLAASCL